MYGKGAKKSVINQRVITRFFVFVFIQFHNRCWSVVQKIVKQSKDNELAHRSKTTNILANHCERGHLAPAKPGQREEEDKF